MPEIIIIYYGLQIKHLKKLYKSIETIFNLRYSSTLFYFLFYYILFCSTWFYFILFSSILFYSILFRSITFILFYDIHFVLLHYILFYFVLLRSILFYFVLFFFFLLRNNDKFLVRHKLLFLVNIFHPIRFDKN